MMEEMRSATMVKRKKHEPHGGIGKNKQWHKWKE
jgi:hypothetical protein